METEFSPVGSTPWVRENGVTRVLLRTADEGNRRQLTKWFADQETYNVVEAGIQTGEFDCCILDWAALRNNQDAIRTRKQAERMPLPFVLLLPEQRANEIIKTLQNDPGDLHSLVDELLRIPVSHLELEQRLESVLRARHQAVVIHEDFEYVSRGFEQQSGYSAEEVLGKTPNVLNSGTHDESFFTDLWETITSGGKWQGEVVNEREDGEQYIVDQVIMPLTGPEGDIEQFVPVNHEITELRKLADSVNEHREQLELLNRVLRHDIRNDMSVILGWMEMLDAHVDSDGEEIRGTVFVVELPTSDSSSGDGLA